MNPEIRIFLFFLFMNMIVFGCMLFAYLKNIIPKTRFDFLWIVFLGFSLTFLLMGIFAPQAYAYISTSTSAFFIRMLVALVLFILLIKAWPEHKKAMGIHIQKMQKR